MHTFTQQQTKAGVEQTQTGADIRRRSAQAPDTAAFGLLIGWSIVCSLIVKRLRSLRSRHCRQPTI